jgi:triosephosphate isomerase (TIM)
MNSRIIAANWKLNKNPQESSEYLEAFSQLLNTEVVNSASSKEIVFFPPATSLGTFSRMPLPPTVQFGGQNCYKEFSGAFTGETSAKTLQQMGCRWVLLGHSERRQFFSESDDLIEKKVSAALKAGLRPMLCIGESLEERNSGNTEKVLSHQLSKVFEVHQNGSIVIAYEPIWAIGTGVVANEGQVSETHGFIAKYLKTKFQLDLPILYGGSVKPESALALSQVPNVYGFLVGGASLDPKTFWQICKACP